MPRRTALLIATLCALAVSGNKRRREIYVPMVREFAHVSFPYCYRCAFDCTDGCRNCGQQYAAAPVRQSQNITIGNDCPGTVLKARKMAVMACPIEVCSFRSPVRSEDRPARYMAINPQAYGNAVHAAAAEAETPEEFLMMVGNQGRG